MVQAPTLVPPSATLRDTRDPVEKRPFVQRLFTDIAPRYDWFNRLASLGLDQRWRRLAVDRAGLEPGQRVLDVCAGTGELALLCARRLAGRGQVSGIDLNRAMLTRGRDKANARGLPVAWLEGDAEALPFAAGSFDRALVGFSTRNLTDLSIGLREMVRVLKPQGRLVVLETGYPSNPLLRAGYQAFLFTAARLIGWLLTGRCWPFTYLARSVRQFVTPQQLMDQLRAAGTTVQYVPLSGGLASLYMAIKR
jgi:demethylmenaquinone methyltransferase/2-methoxy-6-polyprenyl-1,4-benzoquinol methylase